MVKNSREGNQNRNKRYREALAARGIRPVQVLAPEGAHQLIRQAAGLMTLDDDPLDPRAAFRKIGGANEPDNAYAVPEMVAELEAAKVRIMQIEHEAEAQRLEIEAEKRQRQALEAERDAARAAETAEREKAQATATEAQAAARTAQEAQERATEALGQAEKAETTIRQARSLPGVRGRLVRWLAGDALR
jgi:multidrug efflux pump subunit AcrA (membrane-fusion protein)